MKATLTAATVTTLAFECFGGLCCHSHANLPRFIVGATAGVFTASCKTLEFVADAGFRIGRNGFCISTMTALGLLGMQGFPQQGRRSLRRRRRGIWVCPARVRCGDTRHGHGEEGEFVCIRLSFMR